MSYSFSSSKKKKNQNTSIEHRLPHVFSIIRLFLICWEDVGPIFIKGNSIHKLFKQDQTLISYGDFATSIFFPFWVWFFFLIF